MQDRTRKKRQNPAPAIIAQNLSLMIGGAGHRSPYLSHAKRALYHLNYTPNWMGNWFSCKTCAILANVSDYLMPRPDVNDTNYVKSQHKTYTQRRSTLATGAEQVYASVT